MSHILSLLYYKHNTAPLIIASFLVCLTLLFCSSQAVLFMSLYLLFLSSVFLLKIKWMAISVLLLAPITRFPGFGEYIEPIQFVLFISVIFFWFMNKLFSHEDNKWDFFIGKPLNSFIIFFVLLITVNVIFSVDTKASIKSAVIHIINFSYLYFFLDISREESDSKKLISAVILGAVFVALVAILQYCIVQFRIIEGLARFIVPAVHRQYLLYAKTDVFRLSGYRSTGMFYHPNLLGVYLAMILPISVSLLLYTRNIIKRSILIFSIFVIVGGIICSGSRGAFVNLLCSSTFLSIVYWKRIMKIKILLFAVLIIGCMLLSRQQIISYFRLVEGASFRDIIWGNAFYIFKERFLTGWGLGTFPLRYYSLFGFPSVDDFEDIMSGFEVTGSFESMLAFNAHNLFLNYAVEMGIIAVFLMFYFYWKCIGIYSFRLFKASNHGFYNTIIIGVIAAIIGNFVHGFFETYITFNNLPVGIIFIFIVSSLITANNKKSIADGKISLS